MSDVDDLRELIRDMNPDEIEFLVRDLSPAALSVLSEELDVRSSPVDIARYRDDPVAWVSERLDESMWSKQAEIFRSVADNRRTAVKSCHGVGKSHLASRAVAWWLDVHGPGEAFVVTTAPTF